MMAKIDLLGLIKKNYLVLFFISLFDTFFLMSYFLVSNIVGDKLGNILAELQIELSKNSKSLFETIISKSFALENYPVIKHKIKSFLIILGLKYVILFIIFLLTQYFLWQILWKAIGVNKNKDYIYRFIIANTIFLIWYVFIDNIDLIFRINNVLLGVQKDFSLFNAILKIILYYFFAITIVLIQNKKINFRYYLKLNLIIAYLIFIGSLWFLNIIIASMTKFSLFLGLVCTIFILIPLITLHRLYIINYVVKIYHRNKQT